MFHRTSMMAAIAAAVLTSLLLSAPGSAQNPEMPSEGWEWTETWDWVEDEHTKAAQAEQEDLLEKMNPDLEFTPGSTVHRAQQYTDPDRDNRVIRMFYGDWVVEGRPEAVGVFTVLPGGWKPGVKYGEWDPSRLIHCPDAEYEVTCEKGVRQEYRWAYVETKWHIQAVKFLRDGSAVSVVWYTMGSEEIEADVDQVMELTEAIGTVPVWKAWWSDFTESVRVAEGTSAGS
ncbi:hypothetical protein [Salininema proteolyticum]|uniref:Methanolan biosynthesis EpsI domain-containing protein n=1 Tax=Salininema proteolyticum TaxID=1607685 RepID=A0ABV8U1L1_9ACTN